MSLKTVVLHGSLADHIPGGRFECDFDTAREAASAIEASFRGFYDKIREMQVHVIAGETEHGMNEDEVVRYTVTANELHIMPAMEGAGGGKGILAVLGVVLIGVAIVMTAGAAGALLAGNLGAFGTAMMGASGFAGFALNAGIGLVLSSLAQPPEAPTNGERAGLRSTTYGGPLNTNAEGAYLPYVAGREVIVGGVVIHTDLQVELIVDGDDD